MINSFLSLQQQSASNGFKVLRLLRLVRVGRTLDQYFEYGGAVLVLLIFMFVLIAHWFACIWFAIGHYETFEASNPDSWLFKLAKDIGMDFRPENSSSSSGLMQMELTGGPSNVMAYITALYFTLTCLTSVGFGNVSATTENEKIFACAIMIFGCKLII